MSDISYCLWFHADAEEAARYYVALFPDSRITGVLPGPPGSPPVAVNFQLGGKPVLALNGRPQPGFTDAHSLVVTCDSQEEIDRYWAALTDGGAEGRCGWLTDRFGVSWQIVPRAMPALLGGGGDPAASQRAVQAMLGMKKLDIAALERARDGVPA